MKRKAADSERPLVSLIMIVRDEAALVADLLRHHRPLYDEAVVADTGSRDGTAAAAAAAGARVVDFPWQDDFAAARNAALAAASGRWILSLDADERIAARDLTRVRALASRGGDCCWLFPFRTYTPHRHHPEWQPVGGEYPGEERGHAGYIVAVNVRLYPNRPELRYRGRVHESVEPDARRLGLALRGADVPIHHYGLVRPESVMAGKYELYGRLVRAKWEEAPQESGACLEMACRLIEEQRYDEALPLLRRLAAWPRSDAHVQRGRLYLAHLLRRTDRPAEAVQALGPLVAECPQWLQPWLELARALVALQRWSELGEALRAAVAACGSHPVLRLEECVALVGTRRLPEAAALAAELAGLHPHWAEAQQMASRLRQFLPAAAGVPEPVGERPAGKR